jgi:lipopolysaccharide transport system ATP-binding protein
MSQPVITVEGLGKRYTLHHQGGSGLLRDQLAALLRNPFRKAKTGRATAEEFWALRDVNFTVNQGDVVGIIGRNGAGKSTLLKILSRITEPTTGRITIQGRVASLLEVGTGFHGELSGRENIYLNGAILGMKRAEIRQKFDEIVAFSEVEKFLDTPVKHYSSGMYVRLAFAVAAHLEPEILIVDEVLAVGDAAFQQKCLGKMKSIAGEEGRTVLFVSHNLASVQALCGRCVLLKQGRLAFIGDPAESVNHYIQSGIENAPSGGFSGADPALRVDDVIFNADQTRPRIEIEVTVRSSSTRRVALEFQLSTVTGLRVAVASAGSFDPDQLDCTAGETQARWAVDASRLATGSYQVAVVMLEPLRCEYARVEHPVLIDVLRSPRPPATRVLQQNWQIGHVELDAWRLNQP